MFKIAKHTLEILRCEHFLANLQLKAAGLFKVGLLLSEKKLFLLPSTNAL